MAWLSLDILNTTVIHKTLLNNYFVYVISWTLQPLKQNLHKLMQQHFLTFKHSLQLKQISPVQNFVVEKTYKQNVLSLSDV